MELPHLGAHCSLSTCKRLDFLPVKCSGCASLFCGDHFGRDTHSCPSASSADARVPVCPLCDRPVPIVRKGDAPDVAVSAHIDADCQSDPAKERRGRVFDKRCSLAKCKKKEMVRLTCQECGNNYCLSHRHPLDHKCQGKKGRASKSLEAALSRQQQQQQQGQDSNKKKKEQEQMASDEALARALQASLQQGSSAPVPAKTQEELDMMMALQLSQQGVEEEEQQQRQQQQRQNSSSNNCIMS